MISLFDTPSRQKKPFEPLDPERVRMYSCGPTVWDYADRIIALDHGEILRSIRTADAPAAPGRRFYCEESGVRVPQAELRYITGGTR